MIMFQKVGFIGTGNMGGAVAKAVCRAAGASQVLLSNRTPEKAQALAAELGCAAGTNEQAAACRYLSQTEQSVTEISEAVGFSTLRTFNRAFLRHAGATPSAYRKNKSSATAASVPL